MTITITFTQHILTSHSQWNIDYFNHLMLKPAGFPSDTSIPVMNSIQWEGVEDNLLQDEVDFYRKKIPTFLLS